MSVPREAVALGRSDELFRKIFDHANDAILVLDPARDEILDANPSACRMLGYSRDELLRMRPIAIHPHEVQAFEQFAARVLAGGAGWTNELSCMARSEEVLPAEISASVFDVGDRSCLLACIRDITGRKRAEEALRAAHAEVEQRVIELQDLQGRMADRTAELEAFSYSISHDLRGPLRAILGFARMLEQDYSSALDEEGHRLLRVIAGSGQTMEALIEGLLAFSHLGLQEMRFTTIDMNDLARSAVHELVPDGPPARIEIHYDWLPPTRGDRTMLRQVLVNLLANAVKFTRDRDRAIIRIGATAGTDGNVYFVRDNGVGFEMAHAHKLFGVFQRLHHADEFEGTGVGLAIVHQIVRRHGGRTWAEGVLGEGAAFFVSLPRRGDHP